MPKRDVEYLYCHLLFTLAFAFLSLSGYFKCAGFNVSYYLISIAVFGFFQAMYMANAGGAWDNAKKVVEVDLKKRGIRFMKLQ